MVKVSILGATGYTGQELARMLSQHPQAEIVGLGSQSYVDQPFSQVYPHFRGVLDMSCQGINNPKLIEEADVVFLALPHGLSVPLVQNALKKGKRVIDLGADFRLRSPEEYTQWYNKVGPDNELLKNAVYGLVELKRFAIKNASIIANPGCYPTTILLGMAPLLKGGLIDPNMIIIDSKSGVSGAGRSAVVASLYSEANENFKAYGLPKHRHTPEIEQELSLLGGQDIKVSFTPHLLPMTRGMLSTIYTIILDEAKGRVIHDIYRKYYEGDSFIRILPEGELPQTKWVLGTNYCDIGLSWDERTNRLTVISVIDNLIKGASGQAIQNMNVMCDLEEGLGLSRIAMYP